ncbi:unnamed protein product [Phytophthora lilii]|uniref:Unnamed protein product n=1 Tax=Phytophthora lilii TaxID=2077276 RepID=A0A9W7DAF2_9STRA|nr:unnamed protein product [Phytophthora lilii]
MSIPEFSHPSSPSTRHTQVVQLKPAMKFVHAVGLASTIEVFVEGLSFSDFASKSTPSSLLNQRNANTGLTTEDEDRIYEGSKVDIKK